MNTIQQDLLDVTLALRAFVEQHLAGKHNQKTHGNKYGGYSTTKESLRRLKGDKEAREKYKARARKRKQSSGAGLKKANSLLKSMSSVDDPKTYLRNMGMKVKDNIGMSKITGGSVWQVGKQYGELGLNFDKYGRREYQLSSIKKEDILFN
jgi:hypothetical protein